MQASDILAAAGPIIGGIGTMLTVIFGLNAFQRQQKAAAISKLREDTRLLARRLGTIDRRLVESFMSNRGLIIAREIRDIANAQTGEELKQFVSDRRNFNVIVSAIYRGEGGHTEAHDVHAELERLVELSETNSLHFPVLAALLRNTVYLADGAVRALLSARLMTALFRDGDLLDNQSLREEIDRAPNIELATAALGDFLGQMLNFMLKEGAQAKYTAMRNTVTALSDFVTQCPKPVMDKLVARRRRDEKRYLANTTNSFSGDMRLAAGILQYALGSSLMNKVIEATKEYERTVETDSDKTAPAAPASA